MTASPLSPTEFVELIGATDLQLHDLALFQAMVTDWNTRINLVGPSFAVDFWRRHALDCAQLFHVEQGALRWSDVGTGAGFPGVVLAIMLKSQAGAAVHLIESLAKRVNFLRTVCERLELPAVVHHDRAEGLTSLPSVDVVTARACAPLPRLLDYTAGFFRTGARGVFLKGAGVDAEIIEARKVWRFHCEVVTSLSDASGRILRINGVSRRA